MEYSDLSRPQLVDLLRRGLAPDYRRVPWRNRAARFRKKAAIRPNEFEKGRLEGTTDAAQIAAAALHGGSEYAYPRVVLESFPRWYTAVR